MRTTSGAEGSENFKLINELAENKGLQSRAICVECAGLTRLSFGLVGQSVKLIESGVKRVLTAVLNAVEFASR
ncbi:hypothetical protein [Pseudomonas turukhanskensis]|uniref:hypothetical protein n=1 Tax=Pseudomonas turukhanskensis TaxID=1806536 RepID=UPI0022F2FE26|nr:hypothetical protein [Pseudomonas turukhanskensis]